MRITGTLSTVGTITTCSNYPQEFHDDLNFETAHGLVIVADNDTLRAASNLLCATVDIYPHAEFLPANMECTPENFAHCLARLAHAEDHLAREVRSSQALAAQVERLEAAAKDRANSDAEDARRRELEADTKAAAWVEYTSLRRQLREATDEVVKMDLAGRISAIGRTHNFDPPTRALEALQVQYDALRMQHDAAVALWIERETAFTASQNAGGALQAQHTALLAKQAEQERLMTAYRVKYHEADRALMVARGDVDALGEALADTKAILAECTPPGFIRGDGDDLAAMWETFYAARAQAARDLEDDDERGRDEEGNALA